MKRLLFAFFLLASIASASPAPMQRYWGWNCPRTMIAGSRTFCTTSPGLGFTYTVNALTNVFTADASYAPINGDLLTLATDGTDGTLPTGLSSIGNGQWPNYAVCGVSGQTFILRQAPGHFSEPDACAGPQATVSDTGTGTHHAYLYNPVTIYLDADPTGFPASTTFSYMGPAAGTFCSSAAPTLSGKPYSDPFGVLCIVISIPSNATPGTMTTHYTWCTTTTSTNCTTFDWVIEVIAPPSISYTPPGSFTAIPGRAGWETVMTNQPCPGTTPLYQGSDCGNPVSQGGTYASYSGPANFCYPLAGGFPVNNLGSGGGAGVSYYGWNLLFDNMAIYTGESRYRTTCFADGMGHASYGHTTLNGGISIGGTTLTLTSATNFGNFQTLTLDYGTGSQEAVVCSTLTGLVYTGCQSFTANHSNGGTVDDADLRSVKAAVTANNGAMVPYAHFTESLFRAARVFNDSSYSTAGLLMQNNLYPTYGPNPRFDLLRENAYGLDDTVALHKYGGFTSTHWADQVDGLISLVLRGTESDASGVRYGEMSFMLSLAAHALIASNQQISDSRTPYLVKRVVDLIWAQYDSPSHSWTYSQPPTTDSPWCLTANTWWANADGWCGVNGSTGGGVGANYIANGYQQLQMHAVQAFWWYYAYTGDTTYRDRGDELFQHVLDWGGLTGKNSSEVYYNSFNAVGWRSGACTINQWYGDVDTGCTGKLSIPAHRSSSTSRRGTSR